MEHIFVGFVILVVRGQGSFQPERHIGTNFPVGGLAPAAVSILYALVHRRNTVLALNGDVLIGHLKQSGVSGVILSGRAGVHQQIVTGGQFNTCCVIRNSGSDSSQMPCGHIGKCFRHITLIGIGRQNLGDIQSCCAGCKDICVICPHVEAGIPFQRGEQRISADAISPLHVAQRNRVFCLRTGKNPVRSIAVRRLVRNRCRGRGSSQGKYHEQSQQKAGKFFHILHGWFLPFFFAARPFLPVKRKITAH